VSSQPASAHLSLSASCIEFNSPSGTSENVHIGGLLFPLRIYSCSGSSPRYADAGLKTSLASSKRVDEFALNVGSDSTGNSPE
jgi:hypothetical protein